MRQIGWRVGPRQMSNPMSDADQSHDRTLTSLSEVNRSLRQEVVDLLLSITILKETESARTEISGPRSIVFKATTPVGNKDRGQQCIKRNDHRL
jgi:hypothetical protein